MDRPGHDRLRRVRRRGRARARGRRLLARRRHRPVLDARLRPRRATSPRASPRGAGVGPHEGRSARPRLLGEVVPGRLGVRDARADPALVLLAAVHVGRRSSARRRTAACSATRSCTTRPAAPMHKSWGNAIWFDDADRADGRRRHAAGCSPAQDTEPEHELRLRAGQRGRAAPAHALEHLPLPRPATPTPRASARSGTRPTAGRTSDNPLDRWMIARAQRARARLPRGARPLRHARA